MPRTQVRGEQVGDGEIQRDDLDITTTTQAVVRKLIQGTGVTLSSTGVDSGTGDVTINAIKTVRIPHTWAVKGAAVNGELPGFFVSLPAGQTASIVNARYATESGTVTAQVRKNGTALTDLTALAVTSTATTTDESPDVSLADGDYVDLNLSSVVSPVDLRFTVFIEYTV